MARAYRLYVPAGAAATGLMIFLHGLGGSDAVRHAYEVATSADRYGFVGVVPTGSPMAANESAFEWNIDDAAGANEVEFVHAVVRAVRAARPSLADAPTIALGFSNGAGLAALLGCHDSTGLWVAHVAVHYADSSDFPSTCEAASTPDAEWSAVGDLDYFIKTPTPDPAGVLAQFEQSGSSTARRRPRRRPRATGARATSTRAAALSDSCASTPTRATRSGRA